MRKEDAFLLGHISRLHGYKGELVAFIDSDQPERYYKLESVFVDLHGALVPFFISELSTNSKGHLILRFEDVEAEDAQSFVGRELWLPLTQLPKLTGKKFYYHEVIGFSVIDHKEGLIGHCADIIEGAAQPLFRILQEDLEILVPAVDQIIESIDREKREILLNCPDGLLDLYRKS